MLIVLFHVKFHSAFTTVSNKQQDNSHGMWKILAQFKRDNTSSRRAFKTSSSSSFKAAPMQPSEGAAIPSHHPMQASEGDDLQQDFDVTDNNSNNADDNLGLGTGPNPTNGHSQPLRRSTRIKKLSLKALENLRQEQVALTSSLEVANPSYDIGDNTEDLQDPIAFAAKTNKDTMYYHQAMKAKDARQFQQAMQKEIDDHTNYNHWKIIPRSEVPEGHKVIDSVWAMRRKRRIKTKEVYKWKSHLNMHGGQQIYGEHYWETFSAVA